MISDFMRRRVITVIKQAEAGIRLHDLLVKRYRFKSREQWCMTLSEKKVLVNGSPAEAATLLNRGDGIFYEAPEAPEPEVDRNITIIHEDEQLIAVNKTGNLPCHPGGCYLENTLLHILKEHLGLSKLHLINRLDRETSGIVLVAKDTSSAKRLSDQFLFRTVRKFYSVIVEGDFPDELNASGWLMADINSDIRKKRCFVNVEPDTPPPEKSEWAETRFNIIKHHEGLSLLNVELLTGRLHQILATVCSLGYPVVGDKMYGVDDSIFIRFISDQLTEVDRAVLRLKRQALHARELYIKHPVSREPMLFKAPLPEDISRLGFDIG